MTGRGQVDEGRSALGLCLYGMTYTIGFQGGGTSRVNPKPMQPESFLELAESQGLAFVEIEPRYVSPADLESDYDAFRCRVEAAGMGLVCSTLVVTDRNQLEADLKRAARLGARTVRVLISRMLEGDRASIGGKAAWDDRIEAFGGVVEAALPLAESLGLCIAVENHQDADSDDLVALCRRLGSDHFGITLDVANALAVAEEPLAFARRLLPWIRHVHLKDYRIHPSESGYRLARCALGDGAIDFPGLLVVFRARPQITLSIELAALQVRHIRVNEESYWDGFNPRTARSLAPVLKLVARNARHDDWRTPWEREEDDRLAAWELDQVLRSVTCLRALLANAET